MAQVAPLAPCSKASSTLLCSRPRSSLSCQNRPTYHKQSRIVRLLTLALTTFAPASLKSWSCTNLHFCGGAASVSLRRCPGTTTDISSSCAHFPPKISRKLTKTHREIGEKCVRNRTSSPWKRTYSTPRSFCTAVSSRCQSARMAVAAAPFFAPKISRKCTGKQRKTSKNRRWK